MSAEAARLAAQLSWSAVAQQYRDLTLATAGLDLTRASA
jgi:hypothetical protein